MTIKLHKNFIYFIRSLRICGILPTVDGNNGEKTARRHFWPIFLTVAAWLNAGRMATHVIWLPKLDMVNILVATLIIFYAFLGAFIRTIYTLANLKAGFPQLLDNLTENDCPLRRDLESSDLMCQFRPKTRTFLVLHIYSWIYVICNNFFIVGLGFIMKDSSSVNLLATPFQLGDDLLYYIGMFILGFLQFATDTGIIFGNIFVVAYTLGLEKKFMLITEWIKKQAIPPERQRKMVISTTQEPNTTLDINGIRLAHLYWLMRVKEFDKKVRYIIGITMTFGFFGLLSNIYLIIWGGRELMLTIGYASWAWTSIFLLFCHLLSSAHLNKTTVDITETLYQIPTYNLFKIDQAFANFQILINQCTSEPIALTFFDFFYLRNESVMAVITEKKSKFKSNFYFYFTVDGFTDYLLFDSDGF